MEGAGPLIGHSFCWEHRTFEVTDHFEVCAPSPILKEVVKKLRDATVKIMPEAVRQARAPPADVIAATMSSLQ